MLKIWEKFESNNWFERNKDVLGTKKDEVIDMLENFHIYPKNVLDIGCANGYRINSIKNKYSSLVVGVDPSSSAIDDGKKKFPNITLVNCSCEKIPQTFLKDEKFDLVIVNFVLHWIQRSNLLTCVSIIDNAVEDGGYLIIGDFDVNGFIKRKYHHTEGIYTYKQKYHKIFESTGEYELISKKTFNHDNCESIESMSFLNSASYCLLRKKNAHTEM